MTVLGIDPGLATVGFGIVRRERGSLIAVDYGVIRTEAGREIGDRLQEIRREIGVLIERHQPEAAAVERLLFSNNQRTVMEVARASGVILLAIAEAALPCCEYSPPEVKLAVTGEGRAEKRQVQYMVRQLLKLEVAPKWDDAADALALAICHHQNGLSRRTSGVR